MIEFDLPSLGADSAKASCWSGRSIPDDILRRLDLVVGAVHSHLGLTLRQQTQRLLRAMEHRYFTILAHPLCRLINSDAHRTAGVANWQYGVGQARRAWLEKHNVLNTRSLVELRGYLTSCSGKG